jgi:hypothetical protein
LKGHRQLREAGRGHPPVAAVLRNEANLGVARFCVRDIRYARYCIEHQSRGGLKINKTTRVGEFPVQPQLLSLFPSCFAPTNSLFIFGREFSM